MARSPGARRTPGLYPSTPLESTSPEASDAAAEDQYRKRLSGCDAGAPGRAAHGDDRLPPEPDVAAGIRAGFRSLRPDPAAAGWQSAADGLQERHCFDHR